MTEPRLEQYPGYFPPNSKPFWTRPKVGASAAIAGFLLGALGAGAADEAPTPAASLGAVTTLESDLGRAQADLAQAQDDNERLKSELAAAEAASETALENAQSEAQVAQRRAVRAAVKQARQEERRKSEQAVAAAVAAVPAPAAKPQPLASTGTTDPQFSACYQANAAGYGNYVRGRDPEYAWYDDRDGDGVVCEF